MNVLFARNDHPGILIKCPNCNMTARHDTDTIGDAIKESKPVVCVLCEESFNVLVEVVKPKSGKIAAGSDFNYLLAQQIRKDIPEHEHDFSQGLHCTICGEAQF